MILRACAAAVLLLTVTSWAQTPSAPRPDGIPKDWTRVTAGTEFAFWGPPDLKEEKVQGVDSFVGKYTRPTMKITFDYGWYSNPLEDPKYQRQAATVDGREAFLVRWEGGVGLYVPKVSDTRGLPGSPVRLQMSVACDKSVADQAVLLLRSVKFTAAPATPAAVLAKAKDYIAANGITLAKGGNLEGWSLGGHWYRMRLWLPTDESKSGPVFRNLLVSDAGTVIDPTTSYDQALNVIAEIAGPARDLPAYQRHIELYLQVFRPQTTVLLHSTKDIARYEDHPLPKDLQTAVTAPWTYDFRPDDPHCVVYTYQQVGGIVERWDFSFQNGRIRRHETIKFPTPVGGAILYE